MNKPKKESYLYIPLASSRSPGDVSFLAQGLHRSHAAALSPRPTNTMSTGRRLTKAAPIVVDKLHVFRDSLWPPRFLHEIEGALYFQSLQRQEQKIHGSISIRHCLRREAQSMGKFPSQSAMRPSQTVRSAPYLNMTRAGTHSKKLYHETVCIAFPFSARDRGIRRHARMPDRKSNAKRFTLYPGFVESVNAAQSD